MTSKEDTVDLPTEIFYNIISFLPLEETQNLRVSNSTFKEICSSELFWKMCLIRDFKENFKPGLNFKDRYMKSRGLIIDEYLNFETYILPKILEKEPEPIITEPMKAPLVMYTLKSSTSLKEKNAFLLKELNQRLSQESKDSINQSNALSYIRRCIFNPPIEMEFVKVPTKFERSQIFKHNSLVYETKGGWFSGFTVYCYLGYHYKEDFGIWDVDVVDEKKFYRHEFHFDGDSNLVDWVIVHHCYHARMELPDDVILGPIATPMTIFGFIKMKLIDRN
jgi:hypothetical protein